MYCWSHKLDLNKELFSNQNISGTVKLLLLKSKIIYHHLSFLYSEIEIYLKEGKATSTSSTFNNPIQSYTAMKIRLHTIADIWSKVGVLWGHLMHPKQPLKLISSKLPKKGDESFQMRYYMTLYVKGLQNCRPSKLGPAGYRTRASRRPAITIRNSMKSMKDGFSASFFFDRKLWLPVTL